MKAYYPTPLCKIYSEMKQQISSTLKEIITLGCCKLNQSESLYCPIRVDSLDIKKHNADFATALQFKTTFVVTISVK